MTPDAFRKLVLRPALAAARSNVAAATLIRKHPVYYA
jgi:hypothetical protein